MKIISVEKDSPLFGKVSPGFHLLSINGESVEDNLDCRFKIAEEFVELEFKNHENKIVKFQVENNSYGDLGLGFESDKIKICKNKCVFCFVHQQPKGMRRALYVRDDDFRFSFTDGNFITLSNITQEDLERIVAQRLSPIYISVHATDDTLRRKLFGNKKLSPIMPQLKYLTDNGITIHTQVVLCPGLNDGDDLIKTISDLSNFYPRVESLGVVPVGLTKYRDRLPQLQPYDKAKASGVIKMVHDFQKKLLKKHNSRMVYIADEFYIQAEQTLPKLFEYEDMHQFENGIGMMRYFLTDFNRKKRYLKKIKSKKKIAIITGISAYAILKNEVNKYLREETSLKIDIYPVENKFWGRNVTVSGLLTGQDILSRLKNIQSSKNGYDIVLLPPNCLNTDDLFLDDITLLDFESQVGKPVKVASYSMVDSIREILN